MSDGVNSVQNVQGDVIGASIKGSGNIVGKEITIGGNVTQIQEVGHLTIVHQMGERILWAKEFADNALRGEEFPAKKQKDISSIREVGALRGHLSEIEVIQRPVSVNVKGTLCPAQLLFNGWWERKKKREKQKIQWKDGLQEWLFMGFELWGPSWDVTRPTKENPKPCLIAQLGDGDEVESLPVIIPPGMAEQVRGEYLVGKGGKKLWVYEANVSGLLYHRSHLDHPELFTGEKVSESDLAQTLQWDRQWGEAFDYCILLTESMESHSAAPHQRRDIDLYSGYIWKCVMPKAWYVEGNVPSINEVFFIWEHTDFSKPDAVAYNTDSLEKKAAYFKERYGELVLLQKSSDLVPGEEPLFCTSEFYNKIFKQGTMKDS